MSLPAYALLAHLIFDYPLQGEFLAHKKGQNNFLLWVHAFMWGLGIAAVVETVCQLRGAVSPLSSNKIAFLILGHGIIDWLKCHKMAYWIIDAHCLFFGSSAHDGLDLSTRRVLHKAYRMDGWLTDPLGLPLLIDQLLHALQIWWVLS